jgi:hypothetical protein
MGDFGKEGISVGLGCKGISIGAAYPTEACTYSS